MNIQQPMQQPSQQPSQQPPIYSNESDMHSQTGYQVNNQPHQQNSLDISELTKVECLLDKDSMKILTDAHAQFSESIINLGIKMFARSDIYKEYMLKEEIKKLNKNSNKENTSNIPGLNSNHENNQNNQNTQPVTAANQPVKKQFASW